jgi:hypothetical protein
MPYLRRFNATCLRPIKATQSHASDPPKGGKPLATLAPTSCRILSVWKPGVLPTGEPRLCRALRFYWRPHSSPIALCGRGTRVIKYCAEIAAIEPATAARALDEMLAVGHRRVACIS